ncbi:hypothetical protein F4009_10035 [Candidatus Poribacteria bacterium]|nr:hypothetical protein [Candidatus Poribacteria bacterium]MYK94315.1 hypothetical protein [Candidatus Poribacteria bacterium]
MIKTLPFLLIIFLMIGCAGYKFQEVIEPLETGNPENAYTYLQKHAPKEPDIPYQFEFGLVAHYANHFAESSAALDIAGDIAEDRYTKSVSKELGSLVTSDKLRPYSATEYERLLSHYYRALNYAYLNQLDGALVECRRATALINYFKGEDEKYDFFGTGFLAYLSGMFFEAAGEWNDALISYKQAAEYYKNAAEKTGVGMPPDIGKALVRLTRKLGFTDEFERYQEQYGKSTSRPENTGELILFYESGYVPSKAEENLIFPILKTDDVKDEKFPSKLMTREGATYEEVKLEYLLRVAIPTIDSHRPRFSGIRVAVGENQGRGVLVEDIETIAIETFNAQRPMILLRTLVRAVGKYLLTRQAGKKNETLGLLTNLVGVLTEQADKRSWRTLPNQIFMVRMPLPVGTHTLNLSFLDANGQVGGSQSVPDIKINPNRITFWNHRTYE